MKRGLWLLGVVFFCLGLQAQIKNPTVQKLKTERLELEKKMAASQEILLSTRKDVKNQLNDLALLAAQINQKKKYIRQLNADLVSIEKELSALEKQADLLQRELTQRKQNYANALCQMSHKNTFENKLMFVLSAETFNQMYRRLRYMQEYSDFQMRQGALIQEKQVQLEQKKEELLEVKNAKTLLVQQREAEEKQLSQQQEKQKGLVAQLQKKQKELQREIAQRQREYDKLDKEINRLIDAEIAALQKKQGKDNTVEKTENGKTKEVPAFKQSAEDRKLSGSLTSNKGKLPVPITGPYLVVSHYGVNAVEGMRNVKINNQGVDIKGQMNAQARAIFEGEVSAVFEHPHLKGTFGVLIRHGDYISVYCNLSSLLVGKGDKVKAYAPVGRVRADASGSYVLQFQLRKNTQRLNPEQWIAF